MQAVIEYIQSVWSSILSSVGSMRIKDGLDILIVSVILYYAIRFIRGRRAGKLALGVLFLVVLEIFAQAMELTALSFLMQNVFQAGLIAFLIVFQPELRSGLEKMGGEPIRGIRSMREQKDAGGTTAMICALSEALCDLAKEKTGALVVIERETKLGDVIRTGEVINADMNPFLVRNLFFNKAPLHDGAVVVRGNRLYAAGCFLPLSNNNDIIKDLGTRHRAAIGMSENSDAVVVVVSEESGTISMALEGRLRRDYDLQSLEEELKRQLLSPKASVSKKVGGLFGRSRKKS